MIYLFKPICEQVGSILHSDVEVRNKNTVGRTGVNTKVPHQSNDLFHSHPDIVAYDRWKHRSSLAIVEVKKLPILNGNKEINFRDPKVNTGNYVSYLDNPFQKIYVTLDLGKQYHQSELKNLLINLFVVLFILMIMIYTK